MIRRRLGQLQIQEVADAQRIGRPPRDGALRVQALKVPQQEQAEIPPRRQTRAPDPVRIERRARGLDERIEARVIQNLIQARIERMRRTPGQVGGGDPHRPLPGAAPVLAHCHAEKCRETRSVLAIDLRNRTFTTGC